MFKNIFQPLLTLTSIPLGFIGVVYAMLLHDRPLSFMALLGVIALAGVIVNNAIVFIDFVNSRRLNNFRSLNDSIVDAASTRLRPIVLTTLTTVVGLLPTAYGESLKNLTGFGGSDPFIVPIALALGWGLTFGSFLTTLTLPALLRILDDLIELTQKLRGQKNEI
jgi:multidrug efflux pump subunit AcrB